MHDAGSHTGEGNLESSSVGDLSLAISYALGLVHSSCQMSADKEV